MKNLNSLSVNACCLCVLVIFSKTLAPGFNNFLSDEHRARRSKKILLQAETIPSTPFIGAARPRTGWKTNQKCLFFRPSVHRNAANVPAGHRCAPGHDQAVRRAGRARHAGRGHDHRGAGARDPPRRTILRRARNVPSSPVSRTTVVRVRAPRQRTPFVHR